MKKRISLSGFSGGNSKRYWGVSPPYIGGCCLIDALEFLRTDPRWPSRFGTLTTAHAIRQTWNCISELRHSDAKRFFKPKIRAASALLLKKPNEVPPFFGDDCWDWAYILEAIANSRFAMEKEERDVADYEVKRFFEHVKKNLGKPDGLRTGLKMEWYGPATYVAAFRLIDSESKILKKEAGYSGVLSKLKERSLELIKDGVLFGNQTYPPFTEWHYGQVAAQFPDRAKRYRPLIQISKKLEKLESPNLAFALARILQGSAAISDTGNFDTALGLLKDCRNIDRPFGAGLFGDEVKASLNILEGVWNGIKDDEKQIVSGMLDEYLSAVKRINQTGILVAIETEYDEFIRKYESKGAKIIKLKNGLTKIETADYGIILAKAKSLVASINATRDLVDEGVGAIILVGIAGALPIMKHSEKGEVVTDGPEKGDVVIGTSFGAYGIREKMRDETLNVGVPFKEFESTILPSDPFWFTEAFKAASNISGFKVHYGTIVTTNGIVDNLGTKKKVLKSFPAGLAVAEEGFPMALYSFFSGIPCLEIRGISDYAQADKMRQQKAGNESREQKAAARHASEVVFIMLESSGKNLFTFES